MQPGSLWKRVPQQDSSASAGLGLPSSAPIRTRRRSASSETSPSPIYSRHLAYPPGPIFQSSISSSFSHAWKRVLPSARPKLLQRHHSGLLLSSAPSLHPTILDLLFVRIPHTLPTLRDFQSYCIRSFFYPLCNQLPTTVSPLTTCSVALALTCFCYSAHDDSQGNEQ